MSVAALLEKNADLLCEVDMGPEDAADLVAKINLVPVPARSLFSSWAGELQVTLEEFRKLRSAIPDRAWERMKNFKKAGVSRGLEEERKRDRLEDRLRRLLGRDLPGLLRGATLA